MLWLSDIVRIADIGEGDVKILKRHKKFRLLKGESYGAETITIYVDAIESPDDFHITLLHEFIHARDVLKGRRTSESCDPWVEPEAVETYHRRPELVGLIKELYGINDFCYYQEKYGLGKKSA